MPAYVASVFLESVPGLGGEKTSLCSRQRDSLGHRDAIRQSRVYTVRQQQIWSVSRLFGRRVSVWHRLVSKTRSLGDVSRMEYKPLVGKMKRLAERLQRCLTNRGPTTDPLIQEPDPAAGSTGTSRQAYALTSPA